MMSVIPRTTGTHRSKIQTALLAAGFGGVLFVLTFLVLGTMAPGYDTLHETISALEFTGLGLAQRINFFIFGLLLMAFALALRRELGAGRGAVLIPTFQFLSGVGVAGDAIFIHEPAHLVCDLIAFNSALLVLFLFGLAIFGRSPMERLDGLFDFDRVADDGVSDRLRSCQPPWWPGWSF